MADADRRTNSSTSIDFPPPASPDTAGEAPAGQPGTARDSRTPDVAEQSGDQHGGDDGKR